MHVLSFFALCALLATSASARFQQQHRRAVEAAAFRPKPPGFRPSAPCPIPPKGPPRPPFPGFPGFPPRPTVTKPTSTSSKLTTTSGQVTTSNQLPVSTPPTTSAPISTTSSAGPAPTSGCDISTFVPSLPAGLTVPASALRFVTYGSGVQNYTCTAAGNYTSAGAVANLVDASCSTSELTTFNDVAISGQTEIGKHYFQGYTVNGAVASKPVFDFRTGALSSDVNGFTVVKKDAAVNDAVNPATNVAWLQLGLDTVSNTGDAASTVFRIATHGGQPPASCDPNDKTTLSVQYKAAYLFYA